MFNRGSLSQFGPAVRSHLTLTEFVEQRFIRMNQEVAAVLALGTLIFEWVLGAAGVGKADCFSDTQGRLNLVGTSDSSLE